MGKSRYGNCFSKPGDSKIVEIIFGISATYNSVFRMNTTGWTSQDLNEQTPIFGPLLGPDTDESSPSVSDVSSAFFEGMDDSALPDISNDLDIFNALEGDEWPGTEAAAPADLGFDFESLVAVLLPDDEAQPDALPKTGDENAGAIATPGAVLADSFGQVAWDGSSSATADPSSEDEALNCLHYEACSSHMSMSQSASPTATSEGRLQHGKRSREASEGSAEVVPKQSGPKKSKAQIEEERLQKRLAKNRRTAAQSRERKKLAMKEMSSEVQSLRDENTRLKHELEVQKMHTQRLVPSSSNSQLVAVWSVLACLYLTSQTAGSVIETLSNLATANPEAAANLVKALSESDSGAKLMLAASPSTIPQRIAPDRCSSLGMTPWRSSHPVEMQTA